MSAVALSVVVSGFAVIMSLLTKKPADNPYPVLENPPLLLLAEPASVKEIADVADTIFVGKVLKVMDSVEQDIEYEEGSVEEQISKKLGTASANATEIYPVEVSITQVIKGDIEKGSTVIIYRSALSVDYEPDLKEGDEMVFVTNRNDYWDGYIAVHPHAGYFYISDDNTVYPAFRSESFNKTSGIKLESLIRQLK